MTKEEIISKWIYHTPMMKLAECVDKAMDEYSEQLTADNAKKDAEIAELKIDVAETKIILEFKKRDLLFAHGCELPAKDAEYQELYTKYTELKQLADEMSYDLENEECNVTGEFESLKNYQNHTK